MPVTAPKLPFTPSLFHLVAFSGAKAQNEEWLGAGNDIDYTNENSFPADRNAILRLSFSLSAAVTVEITRDSGTTWNKVAGIAADGEHIVDVAIQKTSQFNIRTSTAGGVTVADGIASFALREG